jgi:hypothetical protein
MESKVECKTPRPVNSDVMPHVVAFRLAVELTTRRLQMLGDVIAAVNVLTAVFTRKRQLDDDKRKKLAGLCDQISNVLERVSKTSEDRRQSINLCAELRQYVEPIRDVAHDTLESDEINRLAAELDRVCDAWKQLAATAEPGGHSYEGYLDQLAEGAGQFRGLAHLLQAM